MRVVARIVAVGPAVAAPGGTTCQHPSHAGRGRGSLATVSWLVKYDGGGGYTQGAFFACDQHAQEMHDVHVRAATRKNEE